MNNSIPYGDFRSVRDFSFKTEAYFHCESLRSKISAHNPENFRPGGNAGQGACFLRFF